MPLHPPELCAEMIAEVKSLHARVRRIETMAYVLAALVIGKFALPLAAAILP